MVRSPKYLVTADQLRSELARRLRRLMLEKGVSQAELGRRTRLKKAAVNTYVLGQSLPNSVNMQALEQFFGMASGELLPGYDPNSSYENQPIDTSEPYAITRVMGRPGFARLRVDMEVSEKTALQVLAIITNDNDPAH